MCVVCKPVHHTSSRYQEYNDLRDIATTSETLLRLGPLERPSFDAYVVHSCLGYPKSPQGGATVDAAIDVQLRAHLWDLSCGKCFLACEPFSLTQRLLV
jgi:hypothetical protein